MKKYNQEDIKSYTKAQVIELLEKEGVEFDSNVKKDDLVAIVLSIELPEGTQEAPAEETKEHKLSPEEIEAHAAEVAALEKQKSIEEAEKRLEEMKKGQHADPTAFKAALEKRQKKLNGPSNFKAELAKRRGQHIKTRKSFAEIIRQRRSLKCL